MRFCLQIQSTVLIWSLWMGYKWHIWSVLLHHNVPVFIRIMTFWKFTLNLLRERKLFIVPFYICLAEWLLSAELVALLFGGVFSFSLAKGSQRTPAPRVWVSKIRICSQAAQLSPLWHDVKSIRKNQHVSASPQPLLIDNNMDRNVERVDMILLHLL